MKTKIIAHRGFSAVAPENTVPAFHQALALGVDFLEFDVHLSKDGFPIVIHDPTLKRVTKGSCLKSIKNLTLDELKTYDVGSWFGDEYADIRVPTLKEVLALSRKSTGCMIEIKGKDHDAETLVNAVLNTLDARHRSFKEGPLLIGSFEIEILKTVHQMAPYYPLIGIGDDLAFINDWKNLGIQQLALSKDFISEQLIQTLHEQHFEVWVFTVDDEETALRLKKLKIDGIITNHPLRIKALFSP